MINVIVTFRLPSPVSREDARRLFLSTAPRYQGLRGLVRKHYIVSEDGATAGGNYLWQTRADAEALYTEAWHAFVTEKYGTAPSMTWYEVPVIVDNVAGEIVASG